MWHCLEGLLFSLTPEEYCTRVVSSAHVSIYAQEEHCTWVVSSVLDTLCPGWPCSPGLQILADLMMSITGKMISIIGMMVSIIVLLFVRKSRTISAPSWTLSKTEVICWLVMFFLYHKSVWQEFKTMIFFIVMWLCPSFFVGIMPSDVCQEFGTSLVR